MSAGDPSGEDGLVFRQIGAASRKRRGFPVTAVVATLVVLGGAGAGGFYFLKSPAASKSPKAAQNVESDWILPDGVPSMSDAERCIRDRELPCAEADLLAYLKKYPSDARATALLAITLTQDGRHKEAVYFYKKAEGMGVATYDFYAGYAKSLEATGDIDGAIAKNQAALKLVPTLVDVRGSLADELVKKGRSKEALDLLQGFDQHLESEGYPPYFGEQIKRIKTGMGGEYAKEAAAADIAATEPKAAPGQTLVKGRLEAGALSVPVSIDGAPTTGFMVDSGASMISIPWEDAKPFMTTGLIKPGDFRGERPFQLANGSVVVARIYNLRSVKVGGREVKDVLAAVYRGQGPRLLGQSFLKRFKSWSIDNQRRVLILQD